MQIPVYLKALKADAKKLRHRLRVAYITRFHSFTPDDFRKALHELGVQEGDLLCVHSSYDEFLGFTGNVGDAIRILQDLVGADGGLMMPTQPFRTSAVDYVRSHPVTDLARAPSLMGLMTEILRRTRGAARSVHPTHPVAVWAARGLDLIRNDWEARTPCGRGTAYERLLEVDGKILMLGTGLQPMTFYHCVEELIEPLMPFSPFTADEFTLQSRDAQGKVYVSRMRLFEPGTSGRRRMELLIPELKARGFWKESRVGRLDIILLRAADVLEACRSMAHRGEFCYIPAGQESQAMQGE